jgi:hypothetical protein
VCEQIEKKVLLQQGQERGAPITVDSTYVGGKEGMLALGANFYLNSIKGLPPKMQNRARATLEELLLTENGKRRSTLEDELLKKLDRDSLQLLQQKRLIRSESRERNLYYEISHDRIAEAIHYNRRWRIPSKLKRLIGAFIFCFALLVAGVSVKLRGDAEAAKAEVETEKQNVIAANSELKAKDLEISSLLEEAARSARLVAQGKFQRGENAEALAYMGRANPRSQQRPQSLPCCFP